MSDEIRTTNPNTGGQKGQKPERYSLIPFDALDHVARLYSLGTQKYDDHNWRLGYNWSLSFDAMMRHARAFWYKEEDFDPEWEEQGHKVPHLAAVVFHALTLMTYMEEHPELDDRPKAAQFVQKTLDNPQSGCYNEQHLLEKLEEASQRLKDVYNGKSTEEQG